MIDCPKCQAVVNGLQCHVCGYAEPAGPARNPDRFQCAEYGCRAIGTLTTNTRGGDGKQPHPGPWYCHVHFPPFAGRYNNPPAPPPEGFKKLRDVIAFDSEAAAEREALRDGL